MTGAIKEIARQAGLTVRAAIKGWQPTIRLVVLITTIVIAYMILRHF